MLGALKRGAPSGGLPHRPLAASSVALQSVERIAVAPSRKSGGVCSYRNAADRRRGSDATHGGAAGAQLATLYPPGLLVCREVRYESQAGSTLRY
jgi:hypothetical protein